MPQSGGVPCASSLNACWVRESSEALAARVEGETRCGRLGCEKSAAERPQYERCARILGTRGQTRGAPEMDARSYFARGRGDETRTRRGGFQHEKSVLASSKRRQMVGRTPDDHRNRMGERDDAKSRRKGGDLCVSCIMTEQRAEAERARSYHRPNDCTKGARNPWVSGTNHGARWRARNGRAFVLRAWKA